MQTPGHVILNLGVLGRRSHPQWNWPIAIGAFLPDAAMFGFYFWTKVVQGLPDGEIWRTTYFLPGWQALFDVFNSIPLALVGTGIGLYFRKQAIALFFFSIVLHCLCDLPLHHDDAHRHFLPLSQFRFVSPVSYWDPDHYGLWGAGLEAILVVAASVVLWRCWRSRWIRGVLGAIGLLYVVHYGVLLGQTFSPMHVG